MESYWKFGGKELAIFFNLCSGVGVVYHLTSLPLQ